MNIITKSIYKYTYNLGLTRIDLVVYSKVEKMFSKIKTTMQHSTFGYIMVLNFTLIKLNSALEVVFGFMFCE